MSAESPRPSARFGCLSVLGIKKGAPETGALGYHVPRQLLLFTPHQLMAERQITFATFRLDVVQQNWFAEARRLRQSYVARHHSPKHELGEILASVFGHLMRDVGARVEHRQQDALDAKLGVELLFHQ